MTLGLISDIHSYPSITDQVLRFVSDRTGIISFYNFPLIWLFGMRNNVVMWLTGWDFGTYNNFHRWVARVATLQAVIHSIGYTILILRGTAPSVYLSRNHFTDVFIEGGFQYYIWWYSYLFWWGGVLVSDDAKMDRMGIADSCRRPSSCVLWLASPSTLSGGSTMSCSWSYTLSCRYSCC